MYSARSYPVTQDVSWSFSAISRVINGTIYINGMPVVPFETCSNDSSLAGTAHFTNRSDERISGSVRIGCNGEFREPIHLALGTYNVHLEGAGSNIPRGRLLIDDSFEVTTNYNAFFQAQSRIVDGMLLVNGSSLVSLTNCTSYSDRAGRIHFTDNSDPAHTTSVRLYCDYNGVFLPIHLSPGTYSVHVEGAGSNAPRGRVLVDSSFPVTQDVSWSFSAISRIVYGSLWVNGGPLVPFGNCSNYLWDSGRLFFTDLDDPASTTAAEISCAGNFGDGLHLSPGIYRIQVGGAGSNAPRGLATVISRLEIAL